MGQLNMWKLNIRGTYIYRTVFSFLWLYQLRSPRANLFHFPVKRLNANYFLKFKYLLKYCTFLWLDISCIVRSEETITLVCTDRFDSRIFTKIGMVISIFSEKNVKKKIVLRHILKLTCGKQWCSIASKFWSDFLK